MLEIVSPAGSPEGVIAAVQNGADAICLGLSEFNACVDAQNHTFAQLGRALEYCRIRGVKAYLTLNSLVSDPDLPIVEYYAQEANRFGIDAITVQDLGVMRVVRQAAPNVPLHASSRLCIHNLEGAKMAAAMGFSRVTLARELSRKKIAYICKYSPIEVEIHTHGFQCMSYAGQCYMGAITDGSSDARGACKMPCQRHYSTPGAISHSLYYPLALKENCLAKHLADIEAIGVTSIKIDGMGRRPEYSALVTSMYSRALREKRPPSDTYQQTIENVFARKGFTDGYYLDQINPQMLGVVDEDKRQDTAFFISTRKRYLNGEFQRIPIRFVGNVIADKRIKIAAADGDNNTSVAYGPVPEQAFHKELTMTDLRTQLHKTEGTPFVCKGVKGRVDPGLIAPLSTFSDMRIELISDILEQRKPLKYRAEGSYVQSPQIPNHEGKPLINISITRFDQISPSLEELSPNIIYFPLTELDFDQQNISKFLQNEATTLVVTMPRIIHDNEKKKVSSLLDRAGRLGITEALVGNLGQIQFIKSRGMSVRADFGLNVFNSESLFVLQKLGVKSATLPFELCFSEIRNLSKPIDVELITYGRLPLMITETCIIKNCLSACTCDNFSGIEGENGLIYPIVPEFGCRNVLLSPKKLFLGDKRRTTSSLGLWAQRLSFTTENAYECAGILKRYMGKSDFSPSGYMRGLYFMEPVEA